MFWNNLFSWLSSSSDDNVSSALDGLDDTGCNINPATGLPMISDCSGVDVGGSPYGMDMYHENCSASSMDSGLHDDAWASTSAWDDSFPSSTPGWDD